MIQEVADRRDEIGGLCRSFGVRSLDIFGSAANGPFQPGERDLDFLVEFETTGAGYADRFFGLLEGLQELFGRHVDLVVASAITNPYFRESVDRRRACIFGIEEATP
jgi:predicted nucleotidyltransferase